MRANEFRELPPQELPIRLDEVKEEFFNLRFQNATGQLENDRQLGRLKREIARIQTILQERELGIEHQVAQPQAAATKSRRFKRSEKQAAAGQVEAATGQAEAADELEEASPEPAPTTPSPAGREEA